MAADIPATDYQQFNVKGQKRAIRPKLLKLTDDTNARSRKKNKFKVTTTKFKFNYLCLHFSILDMFGPEQPREKKTQA